MISGMRRRPAPLWVLLWYQLLLTPLGLLAPGSAWGEWGLDEIKSMIGYVPEGMSRFSEVIIAILPDYSIMDKAKK